MIKEDEKPKAKRMFDYLNEKFDYQKEYLVQPKDAKMFNENSELIFKKLQK